MKNVIIVLLVFVLFISSCQSQEKQMSEDRNSYRFNPKPLDDDWSKWLVGEWEGSVGLGEAKSEAWMKTELSLNGQFLITKWENEITYEQIQQLKEIMPVPDEDAKKFQSSTFKYLEICTIDPTNGETITYLFDSLRCIAKGIGKREANKEIVEWKWSGSGQGASIRITEKVSDDKFIATEKYTMPGGSIMEDKIEMTRKK